MDGGREARREASWVASCCFWGREGERGHFGAEEGEGERGVRELFGERLCVQLRLDELLVWREGETIT